MWSEAKAPAFVEDKSIGWRVMHEPPANGAGDCRSPRVACIAQLVCIAHTEPVVHTRIGGVVSESRLALLGAMLTGANCDAVAAGSIRQSSRARTPNSPLK